MTDDLLDVRAVAATMPDPLTFATEAERLKARERFCHTANAIWSGDAQEMPNFYAEQFDSRFPPIAPPKMVPWEGWCATNEENGEPYTIVRTAKDALLPTPRGYRLARVRVVEVDDE